MTVTLALDSASLYFRSFFALPESMTAPDGRPHNAIRGFLSTIDRLCAVHEPDEVIAAWDADWRPQWRVDLIGSYKAHRVADDSAGTELEPDALSPQAEAIAELLDSLGVRVIGIPGFEADDVLGSLATQLPGTTIVVSGDRDLVQLVDDTTRLHLTTNGGMEKWPVLDADAVVERFGVRPDQYVDLAVLRGDPSDGLPGVPGIGAKTATALVLAYGGIDGILAAAADSPGSRPMTPRLAAAILANRDYVVAGVTVANVRRDLDVTSHTASADAQRAASIADAWGVRRQADSLTARLPPPTRL